MYDYFMEKLVYQMFILGTGGDNNIGLNMALEKGLGGVILFTKDIVSEQQLKIDIKNFKPKSLLPPFRIIVSLMCTPYILLHLMSSTQNVLHQKSYNCVVSSLLE